MIFFIKDTYISNCGVKEDYCESLGLEIKLVNLKGNQSWIFIGATDAETEAPILWLPDAKSQLTRKDPDSGNDKVKGEEGSRGWDGRIASPIQWTWTWAISGR